MWNYFAIIIAATMVSAERRDCVACVDGFCYDKHWTHGRDILGHYSAIDMTKNMLYLNQEFYGTIKACDLDTVVCTVTNDSYKIKELTVDPTTGDIYALGDNGRSIYKLDLVTDTQTLVLRTEASALFFKDKLYYLSSDRGIYTFVDGQSALIGPTKDYYIVQFIVDRHDHIYFSDIDDNIKWLINGAVRQTDLDQESLFLMALDKDGSAMFYDTITHVLYRVSYGQRADVGAFKDNNNIIGSLLFDRDNNIVYGHGTMYRNARYTYRNGTIYLKREGNKTCTVNGENEIETSDEENDYNDLFLPTIDEFSTQSSDDIDESSNHNKVLTNGSILVSEDAGSGGGLASAASAEDYVEWIILSVLLIILLIIIILSIYCCLRRCR